MTDSSLTIVRTTKGDITIPQDEFDYHYSKKIGTTIDQLSNVMDDRSLFFPQSSIYYCMVVVPSRCVLLSDAIDKLNPSLKCYRPHVEILLKKHSHIFVDTMNEINTALRVHAETERARDYGIYYKAIHKFQLVPIPFGQVTFPSCIRNSISIENGQCTAMSLHQSIPTDCIDYYFNEKSQTSNKIVIFHSRLSILKEAYLSHFRECFFVASSLNENIIPLCRPDNVLEILPEIALNTYSQDVLFDELYYLRTNPDVKAEIESRRFPSGRAHYVRHGFSEGRLPNAEFQAEIVVSSEPHANYDAKYYTETSRLARLFVQTFPMFTPAQFYHTYGRRLGHIPNATSVSTQYNNLCLDVTDGVKRNFNPSWYSKRYGHYLLYPWHHYHKYGARHGLSPNAWFDENFYRSFYPDVNQALDDGIIKSGFAHYYCSGHIERRIPSYNRESCLEIVHPTITKPFRLGSDIARRLTISAHEVDLTRKTQRIWFFVPLLNPDIFFGGYAAFISFIEATIRNGYDVGFYLREGASHSLDYFRYHYPESIISKMRSIPVVIGSDVFLFGNQDIFVTYSVWEAIYAATFAQTQSEGRRFVFFIQEYEAIFHPHDANRFVVESIYMRPHYALFNSRNLMDYFRKHSIGVFSELNGPTSYSFFEHVHTTIGPLSLEEYRRRNADPKRRKRLLIYTRPENHAERNLYEITIYVVNTVIGRGYYSDWEIIGFGALAGPYNVALASGCTMKILSRLQKNEYVQLLQSGDVGLSLIFSPHPGLVHFEMAKAGLITVTNTFETRPKEFYQNYPNIIPADPSPESLAQALISAHAESENATKRSTPSSHDSTSWAQVFSGNLLRSIFSAC